MKKMLLLFFMFNFILAFSKETIISQDELLKKYEKEFKNSQIYEKYNLIYARAAIVGEEIKTITKDGLETTNKAAKDDYIVKNMTQANEEYIVPKEKFKKKYIFNETSENGWSIYKPLGVIKAIKVESKETFYIMAPWKEKMIVKQGDFLASPLDYSEIYRIAEQEFFETYRPKK